MRRKIEIENWERKDVFLFFNQFEEPFWGSCIRVDCTKSYEKVKQQKSSFFLYYLHASLFAANLVREFRYRIIDQQIYEYDKIKASPTINRVNGTFGFSYMEFYEDFFEFERQAKKVIETVQNSTGLIPAVSGENVIHYSSLPWLDFTSLSHARSFSFKDSCPKISFGKMTESEGEKTMPVSIHVHHALVDGLHVGQFIDKFQEYLDR